MQPTDLLFSHNVIPLASIADIGHVDDIGAGLVDGGLPVVEVALRGQHGIPAIRRLTRRGDLLVGAGTVRSTAQAHEALEAGARFVVSPGLDPDVIEVARHAGVPVIPGVMTPSEVQAAVRLGLDHLKLFPAGAVDTAACLRSYSQVYPDVHFMPSGGVGPSNLSEYLCLPTVFAVSGSWITARADRGRAAVAQACRQAVAAAESVRPR
ncbi:bifunctional 4-hydroxy-2-oxoglutarate aldolase/2-dehydro-3-deoxy-phosphogluconate aldolase [Mycobacterium sp. 4D054]|uniref:bifunctional 4-hydroxy-2-oxoglutarate aldolase/2-dehydro-3-deoxy-phosphogluconate aldolase n=1 Tax=unclassified Mycobacterium TaxID=2642494 RepID=UPI0021B477D6|nr:bifunctional 4-hydroxy-2-oxoglutarate aldolase/2-dehydro-3-deoxy-phosphogluconate aldolase [Mycobacterium sp. SMC-8]UXA13532.1 bifunctional 4-hydroxy-2-oxoglutarate aldolase/2-dehydro-3-deoxy-phosphogluconate aldolase [Mycobacterium sp. SMC-8]